MENILIVNAVPLNAVVADLGDLDALPVGSLIAVGDGKKVINASSVAADIDDIKEVVFMTKLSNNEFRTTVKIPRRDITNLNYQIYTAPQNKIMRIGGITEPLALNIPTEGEANITVKSMSYNHAIPAQRVNVSLTKRNTETPEQFVDRLVLALNSAPNNRPVFYTAAKVKDGTDSYFGITFTTANENVDLQINVGGIFESNFAVVTQEAKVSTGKGADILQMEKDFSRHLGNNNYVEMNDAWYSAPFQTNPALNYNVATLFWKGIVPKITTSAHAANNTLSFAVPTGSSATPILTLLRLIASTAYLGNDAGGALILDAAETNEMDNNPAT